MSSSQVIAEGAAHKKMKVGKYASIRNMSMIEMP